VAQRLALPAQAGRLGCCERSQQRCFARSGRVGVEPAAPAGQRGDQLDPGLAATLA
jgi:hypothetical protein